jgi:hypothetical protein
MSSYIKDRLARVMTSHDWSKDLPSTLISHISLMLQSIRTWAADRSVRAGFEVTRVRRMLSTTPIPEVWEVDVRVSPVDVSSTPRGRHWKAETDWAELQTLLAGTYLASGVPVPILVTDREDTRTLLVRGETNTDDTHRPPSPITTRPRSHVPDDRESSVVASGSYLAEVVSRLERKQTKAGSRPPPACRVYVASRSKKPTKSPSPTRKAARRESGEKKERDHKRHKKRSRRQ